MNTLHHQAKKIESIKSIKSLREPLIWRLKVNNGRNVSFERPHNKPVYRHLFKECIENKIRFFNVKPFKDCIVMMLPDFQIDGDCDEDVGEDLQNLPKLTDLD